MLFEHFSSCRLLLPREYKREPSFLMSLVLFHKLKKNVTLFFLLLTYCHVITKKQSATHQNINLIYKRILVKKIRGGRLKINLLSTDMSAVKSYVSLVIEFSRFIKNCCTKKQLDMFDKGD